MNALVIYLNSLTLLFLFSCFYLLNNKMKTEDLILYRTELEKETENAYLTYEKVLKNFNMFENSQISKNLIKQQHNEIKNDENTINKSSLNQLKETLSQNTTSNESNSLNISIFETLPTINNGPLPRKLHSAVILDTFMVIFGGTNENDSELYNDLFFFDLR